MYNKSNPYEEEYKYGKTIYSIEKKIHLNVDREILFFDSERYEENFRDFKIMCPGSTRNSNKREEEIYSEEIKISDNVNTHYKEKLRLQAGDLYGCPIYQNCKGASVVRINYVRIMPFKDEKYSLTARVVPFFLGYGRRFEVNGVPNVEYLSYSPSAGVENEEFYAAVGNRYLNYIQFIEQNKNGFFGDNFLILKQSPINFKLGGKLPIPAYFGITTGITLSLTAFSNLSVFLPIPNITIPRNLEEFARICLVNQQKSVCHDLFEFLTNNFHYPISKRVWLGSQTASVITKLTEITNLLNEGADWIIDP